MVMKLKTLLLLTAPGFLFSCSHPDEVSGKGGATNLQPTHSHKEHAVKLSLNNGLKWQTDESTRTRVDKLNSILRLHTKSEIQSIEACKLLAERLLLEVNGLTRGCKMKGPEHEALHIWMEGVLKEITNLKKITSADQGKDSAEKLANKFREFNKYFI
jgi:hypothetical protein